MLSVFLLILMKDKSGGASRQYYTYLKPDASMYRSRRKPLASVCRGMVPQQQQQQQTAAATTSAD
jgi:hypothetical protein